MATVVGSETKAVAPAGRSDFWKDDFVPLKSSGKAILNVLRQDESSAHGDLYRRLLSTSGASTSSSTSTMDASEPHPNHHYFSSKGNSSWNHVQTIPLPPFLQEQLSKVKISTMMGLFAEADLAWMTIDDVVYLWTYSQSSSDNEFLHFQVPSNQPIVSVGLAPPKKGTTMK